ncbi:hypothetical protein KAZ82_00475 [Candidatus Babeliales bacterium]|nr:hypothetical protein [Candidatus Babeliales bacterium]
MIYEYLMYYILLISAFIYLAIGLWTARSIRSIQDYFLANRTLGIIPLTFCLMASQMGSGIILAIAHRAYLTGFWGLLYMGGISLGLLLLGFGLAYRIRGLNISTISEIFQTHYKSDTLRKISSLFSIVSLYGILLVQILASKSIFLGLEITDNYIFFSTWIFIITYSMLGGLSSLIIIDMLQIAFFIITFMWASKWIIPKTIGKYITLPKIGLIQYRLFKHRFTLDQLLPLFYLPVLYSLIEQDIAQKFFAAKNKLTASIASLLACIGLLSFSTLLITFSIISKIENVNISHGANPLILIIQELCPKPVFIIIMCAILGGIMTTASSLISAINANVIQDFSQYLPFNHHKLLTAKIIALLIPASALIASLFIYADLFSIIEISYRLILSAFFIPIFMAYWIKPNNSLPAWLSMLTGFGSCIILYFYPISQIYKDVIVLILSFLGFWVGYLFITKKNS